VGRERDAGVCVISDSRWMRDQSRNDVSWELQIVPESQYSGEDALWWPEREVKESVIVTPAEEIRFNKTWSLEEIIQWINSSPGK